MARMPNPDISRRSLFVGGAAAAVAAGCALAGYAMPVASANAEQGAASSGSSGERMASAASGEAASSRMVLTGASAYGGAEYNPIGLNGGSALGMSATRHVFEGLYDLDSQTHEPYPALAEGEPQQVSDTMFEVAVREGACFSDGTPVTAGDVVNAFQANMQHATLGPLLEFIAEVFAVDERTVALELKYPFEGLLQARLSLVKVFPAEQESKLDTHPIGSGPWAYAPGARTGESDIVFTPNAYYNGPFPAEADSMVWKVMEDDGARVAALRDHAVQVAENVPDDSVAELSRMGVNIRYVQGFVQPFLMFNTLKKPFHDKRVRQALLYAIDAERLVREKCAGRAEPLTSFLPEAHPNYHRASTVYGHDPAKAKVLLAASGVKRLEFTLLVNNNWVADLAPMIVEDLQACGITCNVREGTLRWNEFSDTGNALAYDVVLAAGDPSCYGNDADLLLSWWYGDNVWTRGRTCWARDERGSFATVQQLLQAAREAAGEQRQAYWNQCFDIVADEVPLYGLFHRQLATAWQPDEISGFAPMSTSGLDFLGCSMA